MCVVPHWNCISYRALLVQARALAANNEEDAKYVWWKAYTEEKMKNYLSPDLTQSALPTFFWPKGRIQPSSDEYIDGDNASSIAGTG
jgi:hypothetical protein